MCTNINRSFPLIAASLLLPSLVYAANTAVATTAVKESSTSPMYIGLVSLIIILLFVIGGAAFVLRQLAIVYRDKMRADRSKGNIVKTILLLLAFSVPAFHAFAADAAAKGATTAAPSSDFISGIPSSDFYILMGILILEVLVVIAQMAIMRTLINAISNKPELSVEAKKKVTSRFWDRFNSSVSVEKEKDVLLDHNYDGIQELDNILPPWWKYGFYLTIVVAIIYLYRYQIAHTAPNPQEEYEAEMVQAKADKDAYLAMSANNIDETSVTLLTDAASLAAGKTVFETICFACHAKDGGGGVGPNLTDDYWLHGGGIKDVFKTIKYGYADKGMKSWKDDFSPKQIQQIASYVKSLHGTHPAAPKDKQGELYIEAGQSAGKSVDSTKAKDTVSAGKVTLK